MTAVKNKEIIGYEEIKRAADGIRKITDFIPRVAITLGSGLGNFADSIEIEEEIPFSVIEGFPVSTVHGHDGKLIFGRIGNTNVAALKGRVHYYEGYDISQVVMPVRLLKMLGAEALFLTNAAGGVNPSFEAGDLMLITDHISVFAPNPLIGANDERFGNRFPDMSEVYSRRLCELIKDQAAKNNVPLRTGIYCQLTGPSYETPADIRLLQRLGVDAVGMSTVVEAIAARHMGMTVGGVSLISNLASGISANPLSHAEVQETADKTAVLFTKLMKSCIDFYR